MPSTVWGPHDHGIHTHSEAEPASFDDGFACARNLVSCAARDPLAKHRVHRVERNFQYVNIRSQLGQERHQAVSVARQFDALIEAGGVTHESSKVRV